VKASAPGKIILFGEHAVVYGRPALAVPVAGVRAEVEVRPGSRPGVWITAPDVGLNEELGSLPAEHPLAALLKKLLDMLAGPPYPDLQVRIASNIPVASGMGSGAAVSVALVRALAAAVGRSFPDEQVNALAFEIEKLHHGTPSGIDNTVITFGKAVFFVKGRPPEFLRIGEPFTLVIGCTGIPAPTLQSVADVRKLWQGDPATWDIVFDGIQALTLLGRDAIQTGTWRHLGPLMNENHALLQRLTVSSPELDSLVVAARAAGALGAKLSGGGRGGNMIALAPESGPAAIADALHAAGASAVIITSILAAS